MLRVLVVARGSLSTECYTPSRSIFCRVLEPLSYLNTHSSSITFDQLKSEDITDPILLKYHAIVFCKHNTEDSIRVARLAKRYSVKIIYDIDDLIHRFTDDSAAFIHMKNASNLKEHLETADIVVSSTSTLKSVIDHDFKLNQSIVIRTGINVDKYNKHAYQPNASTILFTNGDNIKVNSFREEFTHVFNSFLNTHPDLKFSVFGDKEEYFSSFTHYQFLGSLPWDEHKFWLANNQIKFAIIPLGSKEENATHHLFSECKTPIKYLEYGALRIPGIYSNASIYREVISHGETGLLVENTASDWQCALKEINHNAKLRNNIADNAFANVSAQHHIKIAAQKWLELF